MKGNSLRLVALSSLGLLVALSLAACGDDAGSGGQGTGGTTSSSTTATSSASTTGQGGSGGGGGGGTTTTGLPVVCDPLELVGGQSIDPGCGLFVDPAAADGGDGT